MAARPPKRRRLARSAEFDRVYRQGRSHANRHLVLYAFPSAAPPVPGDDPTPRLGVSVSRKVGGAVERSRVKRVLREAFWSVADGLPPGHDYVLVARPELAELAATSGTPGVRAALEELAAKLTGPGR